MEPFFEFVWVKILCGRIRTNGQIWQHVKSAKYAKSGNNPLSC